MEGGEEKGGGGRIPSVDGIAAAFPHKILEKISGTPSRIDIYDAQ